MLRDVLTLRSVAPQPAEQPLVIQHREALIYALCEAAEMEHGLMCEYLFAAFTLKTSAAEGVSEQQLAAISRWRRVLTEVAAQEMLHLSLASNLLTALGASPHLSRPDLPHPARHYPPGVTVTLLRFGERALRHFMYLERPEGMALDDAEGLAAVLDAAPVVSDTDLSPHVQDFATVGHLYRSIEDGIRHLASGMGESALFIGPAEAQLTRQFFDWPELIAVTDVKSACAAIESIVEQGEGSRGDWRRSHFGRFVRVLDELEHLRAMDPTFEPARPAIAARVRPSESGVDTPLITAPRTRQVADLANVVYEVLLQILYRMLARVDETDAQMQRLADTAYSLMSGGIRPLGELLTRMPAGPEHPGATAGMPFELFYQPDYLLPHRRAAWLLIAERAHDAAAFAARLVADTPELAEVGAALEAVAAGLRELAV